MSASESYRAQLAIQQRVPLLSGIYSPPPTHGHGPDTAKRYEALENETEFIISQAKTPHILSDSDSPPQPPPQPSQHHRGNSSSSRRGIFNKVFSTSPPASPRFETVSITVLLLPQAGTRPILLKIRTIDIRLEGNRDNNLSHVPDMRSFWGDGDAWHARRQRYSCLNKIKNSPDHVLVGTYMLLYTLEGNGLPLNQRWSAGVSGDACIAKMCKNIWGRGGVAAYEDIDREFMDSGLYRKLLMGLFDSPLNDPKESVTGESEDVTDKEIL